MAAGDQHRIKAAEFHARAQSETRPQVQGQFENLAKAHLRLAEQADLNERVEVVDDLCRELGAMGARPRPRSAMQTERNSLGASIKKRRGRRGIPLAVTLFALAVVAVFVFW